jgi:hypothetical protein
VVVRWVVFIAFFNTFICVGFSPTLSRDMTIKNISLDLFLRVLQHIKKHHQRFPSPHGIELNITTAQTRCPASTQLVKQNSPTQDKTFVLFLNFQT